MILVVTNRGDRTADFAVLEMQRRGVPYVRFNTEDFPTTASSSLRFGHDGIDGQVTTCKGKVKLAEVQSIWFRRPAMPDPAPDIVEPMARQFSFVESLSYIEGLWKVWDCFWVSRPDRIRAAESKVLQLKVASKLGFTVPNTLVTSDPEAARDFVDKSDRVIYKPLRQSRVQQGCSTMLIFTSLVDDSHLDQLEAVKYAPCIFQEYVPKQVDLRVTVFGERVFATEIHSQAAEQSKNDWRRLPALMLPHCPHALPDEIAEKCVRLVRTLGLAFGAIDMALARQDQYFFLEINPNGQWAWIEQRTAQPLTRSLVDLLVAGRE